MKLSLFAFWAGIGLYAAGCSYPAAANQSQPPLIPPAPQVFTPAQAQERFHQAIARSYLPDRSGHLFFMTPAYYPVMFVSGDYSLDGFSHIQGRRVYHEGNTHGGIWHYDTEIPLFFYGPERVKPGQILTDPATQQDLVPTYADLIKTEPPKDAIHGQVLSKAFVSPQKPPKAILTVVFDQGGWQYYRAHPQSWPNIRKLIPQGTLYSQTRVTHVDAETAVGHIAIGTGAYPYQHGVISNNFFLGPIGQRSSLLGPERSPMFINSPSLADVWDLRTRNEAIIFSYAYADRAAIGMAGHGKLFGGGANGGGDEDIVFWYDGKTGRTTTNERFYEMPAYLKEHSMQPYLEQVLDKDKKWFEHDVNSFSGANYTPAQTRFDTDVFLKVLEKEAIGQDNITDLVYLTLKASDACGHAFGFESDECQQTFAEQDTQFQRILEAFEKKVGKGNYVLALTADHGGGPLTSQAQGQVIKAEKIRAELNQRFDKIDNGVELFYDMLATQFYVDSAEMQRNQLSWEDLRQALLNYRLNGKVIFEDVLTRPEVMKLQLEQGLVE